MSDLLRGKSQHNPACWLAAHGVHESGRMPACSGRLVRCHLIPRQLLKREGHGELVPDARTWVLGCGGPTGAQGHHGMLDQSRSLRLPRTAIPRLLEVLAAELGLTWWLDREYGVASEADWRCECGDLNRAHEAFCYRCGAGPPEDEGDESGGERFGFGVCARGTCVEPCGPNGGCVAGGRRGRSRGR